jgi:hypothetical protein
MSHKDSLRLKKPSESLNIQLFLATFGVIKLKAKILITLTVVCLMPLFLTLSAYETQSNLQATAATPEGFTIEGLVENPIYITYAELKTFPLLSETTILQCVGSGQGGSKVNYNWTGVPLFYLLGLAKVIPGTYREVVFNATDGFSSSILLEDAMNPTTIMALYANGTDLEQIKGLGSGYRVALPCRWGYKWVKWIKQIIVVDYDYKGFYEQLGYSDEAFRPNCTMPLTNPPFQSLNVTNYGQKYTVQTLTNSSLLSLTFESTRLVFIFSGLEGTSGYLCASFPKELLEEPYQVYVDGTPVSYYQTETHQNAYLYFTFTNSNHRIAIEGFPTVEYGSIGCTPRPLLK